ncbi:hypothetical protein MRX96_013711 [Rhipicephalus microplus]
MVSAECMRYSQGPEMDPGTSGAVRQAATAKREPLMSVHPEIVEMPAMAQSFLGAASSTVILMPKWKTPSLAC